MPMRGQLSPSVGFSEEEGAVFKAKVLGDPDPYDPDRTKRILRTIKEKLNRQRHVREQASSKNDTKGE